MWPFTSWKMLASCSLYSGSSWSIKYLFTRISPADLSHAGLATISCTGHHHNTLHVSSFYTWSSSCSLCVAGLFSIRWVFDNARSTFFFVQLYLPCHHSLTSCRDIIKSCIVIPSLTHVLPNHHQLMSYHTIIPSCLALPSSLHVLQCHHSPLYSLFFFIYYKSISPSRGIKEILVDAYVF